jgi:hypothetical protein
MRELRREILFETVCLVRSILPEKTSGLNRDDC